MARTKWQPYNKLELAVLEYFQSDDFAKINTVQSAAWRKKHQKALKRYRKAENTHSDTFNEVVRYYSEPYEILKAECAYYLHTLPDSIWQWRCRNGK